MAISMPFTSLITSLSGYFTGVRRVSKTSVSRVLTMILQVVLTIALLYFFPSSSLDTVCTYLILATTLSSIFEFVLTYIFYLIDIKKVVLKRSSNDNYLKKILRISLPVAITSYIRSGLSTLKQMLIPYSLEKSSISCDTALSQYGLINGMTLPILMFPCIIITSAARSFDTRICKIQSKKRFC